MQKAIIIKDTGSGNGLNINPDALNRELAAGWRFVAAAPFGVSSSIGGQTRGESADAAILVIIERMSITAAKKKKVKMAK